MHIRYYGGLLKADEQELPTTCTCPSTVVPIVGDVVSLSSSGNGVKEVLVKDPSSKKGEAEAPPPKVGGEGGKR